MNRGKILYSLFFIHYSTMRYYFKHIDRFLIDHMGKWGVTYLRIALAIVFLWFGALKIAGISPVGELLEKTWSFIPTHIFLIILGIVEVLIGLGLAAKKFLRTTLLLLWVQMAGTLVTPFLSPGMFFSHGNFLLLTLEGEFVVKNFVLVAAGIVIGGYEVET